MARTNVPGITTYPPAGQTKGVPLMTIYIDDSEKEDDVSVVPATWLVEKYLYLIPRNGSDHLALGPTYAYNSHGFTFFNRRFWVDDTPYDNGTTTDVGLILKHNCISINPGQHRIGDIAYYPAWTFEDTHHHTEQVGSHTGRVVVVDASGNCTHVRSKLGAFRECVHPKVSSVGDTPKLPQIRNEPQFYRQVRPLQGLGDLWIKDAEIEQDNGEQFSNASWHSQNILVNGSTDTNPIYDISNSVTVEVTNRDPLAAVDNVRVCFFLANPTVGVGYGSRENLTPIGGPTHPAVRIEPKASHTFGPANWIPKKGLGAHQCILVVAYTSVGKDDVMDLPLEPRVGSDSVTYPFDVRWDNNVSARNLTVVELAPGQTIPLEVSMAMPYDMVTDAMADLHVELHLVPTSPTPPFPNESSLPLVRVSLNDRHPLDFKWKTTDFKHFPAQEKLISPSEGVAANLATVSENMLSLALHEIQGVALPGRMLDPNLPAPGLAQVGEVLPVREKRAPRVEGVGFIPSTIDEHALPFALHEIKNIPLPGGRQIPVKLDVSAPAGAQVGDVFYFRIKQQNQREYLGVYNILVKVVQNSVE